MSLRLRLLLRSGLCVVFVLLAGSCLAAEKRVALVIGNAAYAQAPLRNPVHDAQDMADKLQSRGFEVVLRTNLKTSQIGRTLREFRSKLTQGSVALVFYAGHGLQVKGENYLPTVDAEIEGEEDIPNQSLAVRQLLDSLDDAKTSLNLVFLDACRNNPFNRGFRSVGDGLARTAAPSGTLISFATRPGSVAADGNGRNGIYTQYLLQAMDIPNQPVEQVLKRVASGVKLASKGRQEPWMEGSIEGDFYFLTRAEPVVIPPLQPSAADANLAAEANRVAATDKAVQDALRAANEQAAKERAELKASMERLVTEALERQRKEFEAANRSRDAITPAASTISPRPVPETLPTSPQVVITKPVPAPIPVTPSPAPAPANTSSIGDRRKDIPTPATSTGDGTPPPSPTNISLTPQLAMIKPELGPPAPTPASATALAVPSLNGILPELGDEWEYLVKDLRFGNTHKLRQQTTAVVPGTGILEKFFWDDKPTGTWASDGQARLIGAPTEAGFIFASHWTGDHLEKLSVSGASSCTRGVTTCWIQARVTGKEKISVLAGTFDAIKIEGQLILSSFTGIPYTGSISIWIDQKSRRLLKQYGKLSSAVTSSSHLNFEETVELSAVRPATK